MISVIDKTRKCRTKIIYGVSSRVGNPEYDDLVTIIIYNKVNSVKIIYLNAIHNTYETSERNAGN